MTYEQAVGAFEPTPVIDIVVRPQRLEGPMVAELVKVLLLHPHGLRRWSVMRAIREDRKRMSRDVPQKFEADVERTFRRFCVATETSQCLASEALFYRPKEKAGEVWATFPDRAKVWLETRSAEAD